MTKHWPPGEPPGTKKEETAPVIPPKQAPEPPQPKQAPTPSWAKKENSK
jgi:hypothetical protein